MISNVSVALTVLANVTVEAGAEIEYVVAFRPVTLNEARDGDEPFTVLSVPVSPVRVPSAALMVTVPAEARSTPKFKSLALVKVRGLRTAANVSAVAVVCAMACPEIKPAASMAPKIRKVCEGVRIIKVFSKIQCERRTTLQAVSAH